MPEANAVLTNGLSITDLRCGLTQMDLYTQTCKVSGYLACEQIRLSDVMNQTDRAFLTVENATVTHLLGDSEPAEAGKVLVNKNSVVFIVPRDCTTPKPTSPEERPMLKVTKQRHRVIVEAPPFRISGSIHLLQETQVHDALLAVPSQFIPLTNAVVTVVCARNESFTVEALIVNRSFISLFHAAPAPVSVVRPTRVLLKRVS